MPIEMPRGLPFSVDTWTPQSNRKRYHFLTHAHRDHSNGILLHSSFPIYSTHITKLFLLHQFPQLDDSLFVDIEVGESVVLDDFSVTAFDANHCPGAAMFLFEGDFGRILHTGDCRLSSECLQNLPIKYLTKRGREPECCLDYLFLDCTFGKLSLKMPSRNSAIQQVINCIWKHPDAPMVYLACDLLGQEEILVEVSKTFGSKIYVDKINTSECFHALTLLAPEIISQDPSSRFQVFEGFPKLYERAQAKLVEARANFQPEPLFVRPSAQWYAHEEEGTETEVPRKLRFNESQRDSFGVWHVCYSIHSSKEELEWALQLLQPKRVISTTPTCRAMELRYVKNHCCNAQITANDPLWKILNINTEQSTSPRASTFGEASVKTVAKSSIEVNQMQQKNLPIKPREPNLNLSPSSRTRPITLFGGARLGILNSNQLQRVKKPIPTDTNPTRVENNEKAEQLFIPQDNSVEVRDEESKENREIEPKKSFHGSRSSMSFDASLRKLYRSMNVPVPRPLPSLLELMDVNKRAKIGSGQRKRSDCDSTCIINLP